MSNHAPADGGYDQSDWYDSFATPAQFAISAEQAAKYIAQGDAFDTDTAQNQDVNYWRKSPARQPVDPEYSIPRIFGQALRRLVFGA